MTKHGIMLGTGHKNNEKVRHKRKWGTKYLVVFDGGEGGEVNIRAKSDQEAIDKAVKLIRQGNWKFEWETKPKEIEVTTWIFKGGSKDGKLVFDKDIVLTV